MHTIADKTQIIECHGCGHVHQKLSHDCPQCGHRLVRYQHGWQNRAMALTLSGLICFLVSNSFPFLTLELSGLTQQTTLLSGIGLLWDNDQRLLSGLVFATIFLFPLLELLFLAYVLMPVPPPTSRWRLRGFPDQGAALRWMVYVRRWNMMEVFSLGVLICGVKLSDMADVEPGVSLFAFVVMVLLLLAAQLQLNTVELWNRFNPHDRFYRYTDEPLVSCHCCQAMVGVSLVDEGERCPRCRSTIHRRIPRSLQKTAALLLAAVVLYIPANTLPMMLTTSFGITQQDTIMSGVLYLAHGDTWPLALIVFVASIIVPISKILILSYLTWTTMKGSDQRVAQRMRLYRLTELVGHWSMVDVYVVILMVALVQFGLIANVEAGSAVLAFGGVVVLTMLAAQSFDPRLIWDKADVQQST